MCSLSAFGRKKKFLFRSPTAPNSVLMRGKFPSRRPPAASGKSASLSLSTAVRPNSERTKAIQFAPQNFTPPPTTSIDSDDDDDDKRSISGSNLGYPAPRGKDGESEREREGEKEREGGGPDGAAD